MRPSTRTAARSRALPPIHIYDLSQQTLAGYWQQTVGLLPTTDFSYGARVQNTSLSARDRYDPNAPGCAMFFNCDAQAFPLDSNETQYALHVGLEHRFNNVFSVFGRAARAFRTPNVDERVSSGPAFDRHLLPSDPRQLQAEDPDLARHRGRLPHQVRRLPDAIEHLQHGPRKRDPFHPGAVLQRQPRSDPPLRLGDQRLAARQRQPCCCAAAWPTPAPCFAKAPFAGKDVPLVSRYTASGGVTWNIWQNYLVLDATVRGLERALHGQRPGQHPAPHPGRAHRRSEAERRLSSISSGRSASTTCSMRCTTTTPSPARSRPAASRPIRCPDGPTW